MADEEALKQNLDAYRAELHAPKPKETRSDLSIAASDLEGLLKAEVDARIHWCMLVKSPLLTFPSVCLFKPRGAGSTLYGDDGLSAAQFGVSKSMPRRTMFSVPKASITIVHRILESLGFDTSNWMMWDDDFFFGYAIPF